MASPANSASGSPDGDARSEGPTELDPLDPRRVSFDLFELYCHEMLATPYEHVGRRAFLVEKMRYMIGRLIGEQYDYGRLYNRTCVANMVARLCGRHAYHVPREVEEEKGDKSFHLADCVVEFSPKKWEKVIDQFQRLRENMLRNDAAALVYPSELEAEGGDEEEDDYTPPEMDEGIDEVLASHDDFSKWYNKMLDMMRFHACVSHLQPHLEEALQEGEGRDAVVIPRDAIVAFDAAIGEHFGEDEENRYARILQSLLEVDNKKVRLKSLDEIRAVCRKNRRTFDLEGFQVKFLQLIRSWVDLVLPQPVLARCYGSAIAGEEGDRKPMAALSGKENVRAPATGVDDGMPQQQPRKRQKRGESKKPPPEEPEPEFEGGDDIEASSEEDEEEAEKKEAREDLRRKTNALRRKVKDPLDSCVKKAQAAKAPPKADEESESESESSDDDVPIKTPSFLKQKKSARALTFTDSSGDEDGDSDGDDKSEDEGEGLKLPPKFKPKKRAKEPKPIRVERQSGGKKRRRFTEEEDSAIRSGVERFGFGNWADIKAYYNVVLMHRTGVQLKDRWRTLNKIAERGSG